jgi:AraC-like DNA-binding protein/mannose-6-phosphate isomerase-like protein (cupin superfamily)
MKKKAGRFYMDNSLTLPHRQEYSINIENLLLTMLVDLTHEEPNPDLMDRFVNLSLHSHSFVEMFISLRGSITIKTEYGDIDLQAGDIAIIPKNISHVKLPSDTSVEWRTISFMFERRNVRCTQDLYLRFDGIYHSSRPLTLYGCMEICQSVTRLIDTCASISQPALQMASILTQLIDIGIKGACEPFAESGTGYIDLYRISQIEHLLEKYHTADIRASKIAQMLFISERQLRRIVQKRYGTSWRRIVIKKRMLTAAKLLRENNLPAEKIAAAVGFQSRASFYREFIKEFSLTPIQYRNIYR